jgi:hypothetical protein
LKVPSGHNPQRSAPVWSRPTGGGLPRDTGPLPDLVKGKQLHRSRVDLRSFRSNVDRGSRLPTESDADVLRIVLARTLSQQVRSGKIHESCRNIKSRDDVDPTWRGEVLR